jgi:hypothetical protein
MKKFKGLRKLDDVIEKAKELGYVYYQKDFQLHRVDNNKTSKPIISQTG